MFCVCVCVWGGGDACEGVVVCVYVCVYVCGIMLQVMEKTLKEVL